jgi:glycosyltransferase involved in cell wall biosynthesis
MFNLSIVTPAFNEEANIGEMIEDVARVLVPLCDACEIIVVDDGSRDRTSEEVGKASQRHPQVKLVRHAVNQGYGAAVFTGLMAASKDWIFLTDSDRQFDLGEFGGLRAGMRRADLIIGARAPRRDPLMRRLNGWGWSLLVNTLFGYTARDIDCAFKLFRRDVIQRIHEQIESRGATFSAEFLVRAKRAGFTIQEVALAGHRPRRAGSPTGAKLSVIVRAFRELIRFRRRLWAQPASFQNDALAPGKEQL